LNAANIISLLRLLVTPIMVWSILMHHWWFAFLLLLVAGISDAIDGFLAKKFGMETVLGAFLDPLADKVLLVGIFVSLGVVDQLPSWLVILVVSRDLLIVGGALFSFALAIEFVVKPVWISKLNTVLQILLAIVVLGGLGWIGELNRLVDGLIFLVSLTTVISGATYVVLWGRRQSTAPL
jgi:cardiolipin synthase